MADDYSVLDGSGNPLTKAAKDLGTAKADKAYLLDTALAEPFGSKADATWDGVSTPTGLYSLFKYLAGDGIDAPGVTQPAGGKGIRGWLSGIYKAVTGTLKVDGSAVTQPVSIASMPLPAGAATDTTLAQVRDAIKATINVNGLMFFDPVPTTPVYYIRRETVNEGTSAIAVTWVNLDGSAATPPNINRLQSVTNAQNITTENEFFTATVAGTGYSVGDLLIHAIGLDTATTPISVAYNVWINTTTGAVIAAPSTSTYVPMGAQTLDTQSIVYQATANGTGYATGDYLVRSIGSNVATASPTQAFAYWLNITMGNYLAALPSAGSYALPPQPVTNALGATAARQDLLLAATLLGTQLKVSSRSVTPAGDADPFPTIAANFAKVVASTTITRLANTTAYAAGQVVGGSATAGFAGNGVQLVGFSRVVAGAIQLDRMRLIKSQATAAGTFEVWVFRAQPPLGVADAGAASAGVPLGAASATARIIARFAFDMTKAAVGSDGAELAVGPVSGVPAKAQLPASGTDLFAVIVATGPYTPASGETFSIVAEGFTF